MKIKYKNHPAEFEVQACLYNKLIELFKDTTYEVRGEVKVNKIGKIRGARLDIVIFKSYRAVAIIEVKSRGNTPENKLKQIQIYKDLFNLPVFLCRGYEGIDQCINRIKNNILTC